MKKILIPLLVLALFCMGVTALAEGNEAITLEMNTARLPVYDADDPYPEKLGLAAQEGENALPVLVLPLNKSLQPQVTVMPKTVKNKKVTLAVDNEEIAKVRWNSVTGQKAGETVLTIASEADPSVTLQYRLLVYKPVTRIAVTSSEKSVAAGQQISLTPSFVPEDATLKEVTWSSANEQIATVDGNGIVTGVKKGYARITAVAKDGSNIRANISVKVTQNAEEISLDKQDTTVDVGRTVMLKATVLPRDTDNKKVIWSSSDESVATVNAQGRITGVALGECEIICVSETNGEVRAKAVVHVQQPVKSIAFGNAPVVYNGESARLTWTIEPANATNQAVKLTSGNEKVLTVSDDGTITGIAAGETYVKAVTTDGSNRQARIKVKVLQHVTGVHMKRQVAYIDPGQTSAAGAVVEPEKATNHNMTWESADQSVATVQADKKQPNRVHITGISRGETVVTGTTEDGGFQTSILVKVGDWEKSLKWTEAGFGGRGNLYFRVNNNSDLNITSVTIEIEIYDFDGKPKKGMNTKDGSNVVKAVYSKRLAPGATTKEDQWKLVNYDKDLANQTGFAAIVVRVTEFQINNDWVKSIRRNAQPKKKYDPHKVLH